jgi:hypothetical protein
MEISDVRRLLRGAIDEARRRVTERRERKDAASRVWEQILPDVAVPAFHLVASALTGEGLRFNVSTPGNAVRLTPERGGEEFIELALDTDDEPVVTLRSARARGRRAVSSERVLRVGTGIAGLTQEDVVTAVLEELVPFIER